MKKLLVIIFSTLALGTIWQGPVFAAGVNFNILNATPIGSWQVREDIETNAKGKQSGTTVRTSMLGTEMRNDEKHYWVEVAIDSFKITKKGKRKTKGKRAIMKSLIAESTFEGDAENILGNLGGFGAEMIIQNGNEKPMRMSNTGGMMAGMMQAFGTQISHDFKEQGSESVTVPAGTFETRKINGKGSVDMKVIFKKIHVDSDSTMWISSKVPFGSVRIESTTVTNGKTSNTASELLEFGTAGAVSEITQEPEDMPELPNMGELFGK